MLYDGIQLIGVNSLPITGNAGEIVYLIIQDGENVPGLYEHSGVAWAKAGGAGGGAGDLSAVGQHIIPDTDNIYTLGSPTHMWKDLYVGPGSLYVNGQKVIEDNSGTITLSADTDQNIQIRSQGGGDIEFYPSGTGNIDMKGNLSIQAGKNLTSGDGQPISCPVGFDTLVVNNLTVNGTTTTVNSETVEIADNILTLNSNVTAGTPTENAGITVKRGDENNASILWNESTDEWQATPDGVNFTTIGGGGSGGGAQFTYNAVTSNTGMAKDNAYIVMTTSGAFTVTLPANPSPNDQVKVIDGEANASTNNITVARNGQNIMSLAENMVVDIDNANFILVYIDATHGWMIG